jgi:hypothetical protein
VIGVSFTADPSGDDGTGDSTVPSEGDADGADASKDRLRLRVDASPPSEDVNGDDTGDESLARRNRER